MMGVSNNSNQIRITSQIVRVPSNTRGHLASLVPGGTSVPRFRDKVSYQKPGQKKGHRDQ
jgi:hypothetical protein